MSRKDKRGAKRSGPVEGSGPGGKVEIGDIRAKLDQIRGDIDDATDTAKPYVTYAIVAGAVVVVALAFVVGRSRGRRKATWVEIKRL